MTQTPLDTNKRDLPASDPTGETPPRKTPMIEKMTEDNMASMTEENVDTDDGLEGLNPPEVENTHVARRATRLALRKDLAKKAEYAKAQKKKEEEATKKKKTTKNTKKIIKNTTKAVKNTEKEVDTSEKNMTRTEGGGKNPAKAERNSGEIDPTEATDDAVGQEEEADTTVEDTNPRSGAEIQCRKGSQEEEKNNIEDNKAADENKEDSTSNLEKSNTPEENTGASTGENNPIGGDGPADSVRRTEDGIIIIDDDGDFEKTSESSNQSGGEVSKERSRPKKLNLEELSYRIIQDKIDKELSAGSNSEEKMDGGPEAYESIRLFVVIHMDKFEGTGDYDEKFASKINEFLKEVRKVEPGARILPWAQVNCNMVKARSNIMVNQNQNSKYVWNKNKWRAKGRKYLRLNIAFPTKGDIDDVLEMVMDSTWYIEYFQYAHVSPSQAVDPFKIGWFSRSLESMIKSPEFQVVLRELTGDPLLGLIWDKITKESDSRKNLRGNTQQQQAAKRKEKTESGKTQRTPFVFAAHIETERSNEHSTTNKLVALFNRNSGKHYPLGYSLYFVHHVNHRVMLTMEGRQGYLKAWSHQLRLSESLYNDFTTIINIDQKVPASLGHGEISFRQFLTEMKVTVTPGVEGDRLFVAIGRNSPSGMEFCFTYHILAIDEAEEVVRNLPLVYEQEFKGNASDFFNYDLRAQFDGYTWDTQLRQASSPEGRALFAYSDAAFNNPDEPEETIETINPLDLVTYKRLQGQCDETVLNGVDNSRARASDIRAQPPAAIANNPPQHSLGHNEEDSAVSDLTNATGKASKESKLTTRTNGSVGTRQSRVDAAVSKTEQKWNKKLLQEKEEKEKAEKAKAILEQEKDQTIAKLLEELAVAKATRAAALPQGAHVPHPSAQSTAYNTPRPAKPTPTSILHSRDTSTGKSSSGNKTSWNSQLHSLSNAEMKSAAEEMQLAQNEGTRAPTPREVDLSSPHLEVLTSLPPLPDCEDLQFDDNIKGFPLGECSYCLVTQTRRRCYTVVPDDTDNLHLDGAARCARAFCMACINKYVPGPQVDTQVALRVCPFHILQGRQSDRLAARGPEDKDLDDGYSSSDSLYSDSEQPGPGSDRAEAS